MPGPDVSDVFFGYEIEARSPGNEEISIGLEELSSAFGEARIERCKTWNVV